MPKGRKFLPSPANDGKWFSHIGLPTVPLPRTSATTTGLTYTWLNTASCKHETQRFPKTFVREEGKTERTYPISIHDNRLALQNFGEMFDCDLGRKKVSLERRQHNSSNPNLWAHDDVPQVNGGDDGLTLYQTSFLGNKTTEPPLYRRYPKSYSIKAKSASIQDDRSMWFGGHDTKHSTPVNVLALTQHPQNGPNPWRYSYHVTNSFSKQ
ncbi:testis-expressed protein 36 isoform X1 [Polypterus senegalus]